MENEVWVPVVGIVVLWFITSVISRFVSGKRRQIDREEGRQAIRESWSPYANNRERRGRYDSRTA